MSAHPYQCKGCTGPSNFFKAYRNPKNKNQEMMGGWRCGNCGCAVPLDMANAMEYDIAGTQVIGNKKAATSPKVTALNSSI